MNSLNFIHRYYSIDSRSLALMRIGLAMLCFVDLGHRFSDLDALYSENGLWPSRVMFNLGWQPGFWTIHSLFGSKAWSVFVFALHALGVLGMLLGFKTRMCTVLVFLLTTSLHNRNVFVLQAGDDLLRLSLFWGIFLNWGNTFSLDSRRKASVLALPPPASFAYLLMIASVYFFTILLKSDKEWHSEGSALYYALSLEQLRLPVGDLLYHSPVTLKWLTHTVYGIELCLPFLILWPSRSGYTRWVAFILVWLLHLGIGLTLYVGLFYWISIITALGLIPAVVLNRLALRFRIQNGFPEHIRLNVRFSLRHVFIFCLVLLSLLVNFSSLSWFPFRPVKEVQFVINVLRFNQYWGMFSPGILKQDGWMVYHGIDAAGRQWDLAKNSDFVDYSKPDHIVNHYKNDRWRKLAENMQNEDFIFLRHLYAGYVLKQWNKKHPEKPIKTLYLYFMEQTTLPDYRKTPVNKLLYAISSAS